MQDKKFWTIAKYEFTQTVKKPSFWLSTLFIPIFIAVISFVTGYATVESTKKFESGSIEDFEMIYIIDNADVVDTSVITPPFEKVSDYTKAVEEVKNDSTKLLVVIPKNFSEVFSYDLIYKKNQETITGSITSSVINNLLKQSAAIRINNPMQVKLLTSNPTSVIKSFDENGNLVEQNFGQYLIPIASMAVFFMAVFISSSFLLQSVSAEKENRMIETMLSIVDKKSLMLGKIIGLTGVVIVQLLVWIVFGVGGYIFIQNRLGISVPMDLSHLNTSIIPINLFLTLSGFILFAAIMTGAGAVGTGAQDSRNLSSIFMVLAMFPLYLTSIIIADPTGSISQFFTYFPLTSHMILLFRYSFNAISSTELIGGLVLTTIYDVIAVWIAFKLFELGCLMYNRRPTTKEIVQYLKTGK